MAGLREVLALDEIAPDRFRSGPIPSEWARTFGGQIAAQSLMAAARTLDRSYSAHSLHGYFLLPGRPHEPTDFSVERIRDGGSFCARRVTAVQAGEAIFTMTASFHRGDEGFSHQVDMPAVPAPDDIPESDSINGWGMPRPAEWRHWEMRWVPPGEVVHVPEAPACQRVWIRYGRPLPDDGAVHACALTYLSDIALLGSARLPHPRTAVQGASLDHSLWFLRPFRADEWLLYDQVSPSAEHGRALTRGRLFDTGGRLVAAVAQEGLMRFERPRSMAGRDTEEGTRGAHASASVP
ncbi:acyl-CoA thioesterase II [Streptomyces sp. PKU-EA00015]|uniref:acyl-CoA thioesterase n=1 Tax=Streptomyces sp. PKU-EA00015 TaxID=2748326 RepID=UPI00159FC243|nr:acyl-CoA thioesterase II [Streptomyces sp. PKU-EA00015]NWF25786.1 acyl-CoA thioesterase II [Streptomyces sp. PKU-EA00015]